MPEPAPATPFWGSCMYPFLLHPLWGSVQTYAPCLHCFGDGYNNSSDNSCLSQPTYCSLLGEKGDGTSSPFSLPSSRATSASLLTG